MNPDEIGLIETLNELASTNIEIGNYVEAQLPLDKALRVIAGRPSPWLSITLNNLGIVHRHMGDIPVAFQYTRDALANWDRLEDPGSVTPLFYPVVLSNLGALYRLSGNLDEAERTLKRALEMCMALPDVPDEALSANHFSLGLLYLDLNDFASAKPYLEKAIALTRPKSSHSLNYAVQLNALATWNRLMGNLATAVRLHEQVTAIYQEIYGEEHPNYATNMVSLARLYSEMNWHAQAENTLRRATAILEAQGSQAPSPAYVDSLNHLATTLFERQKYDESELVVKRALEIARKAFGENSLYYAACLHNLIQLLPYISKPNLTYFLAEFLSLDELRPTLQDTIDIFSDTAEKGYPALQILLLEKIVAIERNAGWQHSSGYGTTLLNLGLAYRLQSDWKIAEAYLRQALAIERAIGDYPRPALTLRLNALAHLCAATGRPQEALSFMLEANRNENDLMSQVFTTGSELQRLQYFLSLRQSFHVFLSLIVSYLPDSAEAIKAAFDLNLRRKALGTETLAAQRDALLSGKYPELAPSVKAWQDLRTRIAQTTLAGPGVEGKQHHQQLIDQWNAQKETLEIELARHIPELSLQQQLQAVDWRILADALPAGTRLVEFVLFAGFNFLAAPTTNQWREPHYLAFIVSPDQEPRITLVDLGLAQPIDQLIADFRMAIMREAKPRHVGEIEDASGSMEHVIEYGQKLRKQVFDPLLPSIEGVSRIFLANDGDLAKLPFEVLPLDQGRFLIDRFELSYLNSGRDILRLMQAGSGSYAKPVVVADPDFDFDPIDSNSPGTVLDHVHLSRDFLRSNRYFSRLPGTRQEGEEVAQLLEVSPWLERMAVENSLKSLSSPVILHIATHGFFLPNQRLKLESPIPGSPTLSVDESAYPRTGLFNHEIENPLLRSGLALAGANRTIQGKGGLPPEAEDGILTAEDVTAMDLLGTELVVLSACETGLGDVMVGEGVYGLQRAFILAGAKTLVISLWKVPDYQTQDLMREFYRRLLEGRPRAAALRQAQLALKEKYTDPFYWGAFICLGDPSPIKSFGK